MKKSSLYLVFLAASLLSACNSSSSKPEIPTPSPITPPAVTTDSECETQACEDNNQFLVAQIYSDLINEQNVQFVQAIYSEDFVQHNSNIESGIAGQEAYFTQLFADNPDHIATVKHILTDKKYVAVHWHYSAEPDNEFSGQSRIDLYKMEDGMIVEQWNLAMALGDSTASGNSVFSDLYEYPDAKPVITKEMEDANKTMVSDFYLELFNNINLDLIDELVDENYIQHNMYVANGSAPLKAYVGSGNAPNIEIFMTLAEDDLVWTFSANGNLYLVDLWRVDNNKEKIVEHWDVF